MIHRLLFAVALLPATLASSCGGSDKAGPAGHGSGPPLSFAWPVPCHVGVTETQVKDGRTAVTRYIVDVTRADDGENLAVRTSHFEMQSFTGIDLANPEAQKSIAPALAMSEAVPTLLVGPDGRARQVVDTDAAVDRVMKVLEDAGTSEDVRGSISNMLHSPPVVATMRQKAYDGWMVWVGAWVGLQLQPGQSVDATLHVPMPDGTLCDAPTTLKYVSLEPGRATLSATSVLEGDGPRLALGRVVAALSTQPAPHQNEPFDPESIESFRRITTFSVVTDPATLRPLQASTETTQSVSMKGLGQRTQLEQHAYVFDWSAASAAAAEAGSPR